MTDYRRFSSMLCRARLGQVEAIRHCGSIQMDRPELELGEVGCEVRSRADNVGVTR